MRIESPVPADTDEIAELWVALADGQRAFGSHLAAAANRERIGETIAHQIAEDNLLVARTEGEIVGFVMFTVEYRLYAVDTTRGMVHNVYVVPEKRGEGIGAALMDAAEAALVEKGAEAIALEVLAENEAARAFYADRGYGAHRLELEKGVETDNTP
ncbi:GNAT family N-acetyltransferase [Halalkalicoccus subterraneus]|uniref:GNAT family N-acetyltransferase n=1 Tax=Halalkalicoccus subterraneus TaxID=2675002 RepID=UPI000EFCA653|nr:GNAT family N-acetyltransferase [Halalkalicoccus subterraneus]